MAFSLSSWFKSKPNDAESEGNGSQPQPGKETARVPAVPPPAPAGPVPSAVRTVLPSNSQAAPVSLRTPGAPPSTGARPPTTRNLSVRPPARKVSFPVPSAATPPTPVMPAPLAASSAPPPPPLEAPDATVSLELSDFIDRLPPGFLAPGHIDRRRVVEFRASELYSDLSKGKASVPASTIYLKCPDIFSRPVTDTEDAEVPLPLQKLVEQLSAAFRARTDQVAEEQVGEIETPFLQVAMEDNQRLVAASGTNAGPVRPVSPPVASTPAASEGLPQRPAHRTGQISTISSKPAVEPPPAPTFAPPSTPPINPGKRPPSTVRASVAGSKIRLSGPAAAARMVPAPSVPPAVNPPSQTQRIEVPRGPAAAPGAQSPSHQVAKKTARIQIPPISLKQPPGGTGAANTPRPPSMPPPPSLPVQTSPVAIRPPGDGTDQPLSFRASPPPPPSVKLPPPSFAPQRPSFPPPSFPATPPGGGGGAALSVPAPVAPPDDRKIELGLAAVLRAQPASALAVEPETVPDDVRFTLPFTLVEKQLSTGRVTVPRAAFIGALPEAHREVLAADGGLTEVQIPLQEVFQNLPGNALAMRKDQVVEEIGSAYPTPFSQKAAEDAERLGAVAPVAPPAPEDAPGSFSPAEPAAEAALADALAPASEPEASLTPIEEESETPAEPARNLPLDFDETPAQPESAPEEETPAVAPVASIHPEDPAVEPPIAAEPPPVAEALAMLESTAPGEETEPVASPPDEPAPTAELPATNPSEPAAVPTRARGAAQDSELQTVFMTEDELDAKGVVRHVCQLPGVTGCAVMFADGLRLAGNFPEGDTEGFSAMAPPFFKRTGHFATEAALGSLQAVTLYTDQGMLSFFMHADICLGVCHTGRGFLPGVREKLAIVTRELARMYATEKPAESAGEYTL